MVVSISGNWGNITLICGDYGVYQCALLADRGSLITLRTCGDYNDSRI